LLHQHVERAKRLFDRRHGIVSMNLVQVDVVGLQTAETGLHTIHDVAARSPDVIPPRTNPAIDLRRDHDILPRDIKGFQRLPENLFALTLCVIVRRIKEVDATVDRRSDQFIGPSLVNGTMALKSPLPSPKVMVPKQSFETRRPVLPSVAYSMAVPFL
jgi:hypothetical protein